MQKNILRALGLLLVVWALTVAVPVEQAHAQSCVCNLDCIIGKKCCVTQVTGGCNVTCIPSGNNCPAACVCTLDCVIGKHCCTGVNAEGQCTQTCIPNGQSCPP